MLRKDKLILETLTKRYGKNNVLNELEHKTISNAFRKAREESRWQQARVFSDELHNRLEKIGDNLKLEPIFRGVDYQDVVVKIFINKDKNYPIAFVYNDSPGVESVGVITSKSYEDDLNEYYLKNILNKFNQLTNNNIQYNTEESYLYHIPQEDIEEMVYHSFEDKKTAREFTYATNILNDYFNSQLDKDWHNYHNQGNRIENGFDERGNRIYESSSKFQIAENWFNNLSFDDLEYLTGVVRWDFINDYEDDEEADEMFIAACEDWWNDHTPTEKVKIMQNWK